MHSNEQRWTYEQIGAIARRAAVRSHLCGCGLVLIVLFAERYDGVLIATAALEMILFATVPLIVAAIVTEVVVAFFLQKHLPIPLFVRTSVITIELALFSWILVLIDKPYRAIEL